MNYYGIVLKVYANTEEEAIEKAAKYCKDAYTFVLKTVDTKVTLSLWSLACFDLEFFNLSSEDRELYFNLKKNELLELDPYGDYLYISKFTRAIEDYVQENIKHDYFDIYYSKLKVSNPILVGPERKDVEFNFKFDLHVSNWLCPSDFYEWMPPNGHDDSEKKQYYAEKYNNKKELQNYIKHQDALFKFYINNINDIKEEPSIFSENGMTNLLENFDKDAWYVIGGITA